MKQVRATLLDSYRAGQLALRFAHGVPDASAFQEDLKTGAAVLHQLLILGEAVKRLPEAFCTTHEDIPWRKMAGMRDVLIHAYDDVDEEEVWRVLQYDLPAVLDQIEPLLPPMPNS